LLEKERNKEKEGKQKSDGQKGKKSSRKNIKMKGKKELKNRERNVTYI
jgi:hypothetical protein